MLIRGSIADFVQEQVHHSPEAPRIGPYKGALKIRVVGTGSEEQAARRDQAAEARVFCGHVGQQGQHSGPHPEP